MQPRERFSRHGSDFFGDDELLALVIGTGSGTHRPLEISRSLLKRFGDLPGLAEASVAELTTTPGVGMARGGQLPAALHVGRRSLLTDQRAPVIRSAEDAYLELYAMLSGRKHEALAALYLSRGGRLLTLRLLTTGNDAHTIVDPRQVFQTALRCGAASVIIAHNHPSGDIEPSAADLAVTWRLVEVGALLGIPLTDHLIIGSGAFTSLAELGMLRSPHTSPTGLT